MGFRVYVVFFKQKTAYEMRISDWSSDVCSSDLLKPPLPNIFSYENKLLHSCRATAPKANEAHDPSRAPDQHSQFSGVPHRAAKRGIIAICHDAGVGLARLQHCTRKIGRAQV